MFLGIEQHSEIIDSTLVNQVSTDNQFNSKCYGFDYLLLLLLTVNNCCMNNYIVIVIVYTL